MLSRKDIQVLWPLGVTIDEAVSLVSGFLFHTLVDILASNVRYWYHRYHHLRASFRFPAVLSSQSMLSELNARDGRERLTHTPAWYSFSLLRICENVLTALLNNQSWSSHIFQFASENELKFPRILVLDGHIPDHAWLTMVLYVSIDKTCDVDWGKW